VFACLDCEYKCSSCPGALTETHCDDYGRYKAELTQASALPLPEDDNDEAYESQLSYIVWSNVVTALTALLCE